MNTTVKKVETFIITIERDTPYLGPLAESEHVNEKGYIVRKGNGTIYPTTDRSVLIKVTLNDGSVGWGETYGICAPKAVCEIISDLLAPTIIGKSPEDVESIWDSLYDMMRVRGFFGGFYLDAIAAIDIALWDLLGKIKQRPLYEILGSRVHTKIPSYISGLPVSTIDEKVQLAKRWVEKGYSAIKFASAVSHEGIVNEMSELRKAVGTDVGLMVDLHWKFSANDAIKLIQQLEKFNPSFVEAPVKPEDIDGLLEVSKNITCPLAAGEEWRTTYEALERLKTGAINIIQPEMGHTGITQFMRISKLASTYNCSIAPHATIGLGIFMAASLHASSTIKALTIHEYQPSVFDRNLSFIDGNLSCDTLGYQIPDGPGLGVSPNQKLWAYAEQYS